VRINTPNPLCLTPCGITNYNDGISATNPYVFWEIYFILIYRLRKNWSLIHWFSLLSDQPLYGMPLVLPNTSWPWPWSQVQCCYGYRSRYRNRGFYFCKTEPNRNRSFMPLYWRFGFEMEQLWFFELTVGRSLQVVSSTRLAGGSENRTETEIAFFSLKPKRNRPTLANMKP